MGKIKNLNDTIYQHDINSLLKLWKFSNILNLYIKHQAEVGDLILWKAKTNKTKNIIEGVAIFIKLQKNDKEGEEEIYIL